MPRKKVSTKATSKKVKGVMLGEWLKLYHEIHGAGEPLILLHGGVGASECLALLFLYLQDRQSSPFICSTRTDD